MWQGSCLTRSRICIGPYKRKRTGTFRQHFMPNDPFQAYEFIEVHLFSRTLRCYS